MRSFYTLLYFYQKRLKPKIIRRKTNKKETNVITSYYYSTSFVLLNLSIRDEELFLQPFSESHQ